MKKFYFFSKLLLAVLMLGVGGSAWADNVTDVLDNQWTGISGTSYSSFADKTASSGAVYAGQCAGGNSSIQLRSNNSNSGIVTTTSGGKVKSITVKWNSNTSSGRTLNVYGKNTAYTAASDLYNSSSQGTLLGTIVYETSTSLTVNGDYEYIGFRSSSGAMYLDEVSIVWEVEGGDTPATPSISFATASAAIGVGETYTQEATTANVGDATVSYSSESGCVSVNTETGEVKGLSAGEATITASVTVDDETYSATYSVSVVEYTSWVKVTNPFGLRVGKEYLLVNEENSKAMGVVTTIGAAVDVTISNGRIKIGSEAVSVLTLEAGSATGTYAFNINGEDSYLNWSSGNSLSTATEINANSSWTLEYTDGALKILNANESGTYRNLTYNQSSPRFACYNNDNQKPVALYVKAEPYTETVTSAGYATLCPSIATSFEGAKAYIVDGIDGSVLSMTAVDAVAAGVAVILEGEGDYTLNPATSVDEVGTNYLVGVSEDTAAPVGSYVLQNLNGKVAFYKVAEGGQPTVGAGKAYLDLSEASSAKALYFSADDEATAIEGLAALSAGQVEAVYTQGGAKVNGLQKGLNIVKMAGGKTVKVLVK